MKIALRTAMVAAATIAVALLASTAVSQDRPVMGNLNPTVVDIATPTDGSGRAILQYDDGVPVYRDGTLSVPPGGILFGNFFSPGLPPTPPPNYSITAASVNMAGMYGTVFYMFFFNSPAHATAPLGVLGNRAVAATGTGWHSVLFATPVTADGPFLAGIPNTAYPPCSGNTSIGSTCIGVALGSGTNLGYGHNAMQINLATSSAPAGSNFATIPGQNALIRLNGYVPVELMRLEVE
jgi:hypothetical protein